MKSFKNVFEDSQDRINVSMYNYIVGLHALYLVEHFNDAMNKFIPCYAVKKLPN